MGVSGLPIRTSLLAACLACLTAPASAMDAARSARYLPARLVAEDEAQAERFRVLARGFRRDSTRHFSATGRRIEVSHDLMAAMAAQAARGPGSPAGAWRAGAPAASLRPSGFASLLALRHGIRLRPASPAYAAYTPDDPGYRSSPQWALRNDGMQVEGRPAKAGVDIGIEKVWDKFSGSDSLVIAVVDAGWNFRHPELAGRHWVNRAEAAGLPGVDDDGNGFADDSVGWDFVDGDNRPEDFDGHGTLVGGVLAAGFDDGRGIAGILAQGRVMPIRVLDAAGHGDQVEVARGIRYALRNGAHVINFSIGGGQAHPDLRAAFEAARDAGVPIVGAAGNEGLDVDKTPAIPSTFDFENLVVVGSHGPDGAASAFSNYGSRVHLSAPGEQVLTCGIPERAVAWSEGFEDQGVAGRWTFSDGIGISEDRPLEGGRSLAWASGQTVSATLDQPVDLTGLEGAAVTFLLDYHPSDASDVLILEGNREGSSTWREIAVLDEPNPAGSRLEFALRGFDGSRVRLRFRTRIDGSRLPADRRLRIDALAITVPDPDPPTQEVYNLVDGTSLAAPHVAAYVGLQRLACDRLGVPWTRGLALEGIAEDPVLVGKVATSGRLDASRGLQFYLSTLPDLVVRDSTALSWAGGQRVQYSMEVVAPQPGQRYRYQAYGLPTAVELDSTNGTVTWQARGPGSFALKLVADGPVRLRRRLSLRILPVQATTAIATGPAASLLRIGGRAWRLPPRAPSMPRRLEVVGADAAGRSRLLLGGWLAPEDMARPLSLPPGAEAFPFLRVRLDGAGLQEGK